MTTTETVTQPKTDGWLAQPASPEESPKPLAPQGRKDDPTTKDQNTHTIRIWTVACDDDNGTSTHVFDTEREAEVYRLEQLFSGEEKELTKAINLLDKASEGDDEAEEKFYQMVENRLDGSLDTYSVDYHDLQFSIPAQVTLARDVFTHSQLATILHALEAMNNASLWYLQRACDPYADCRHFDDDPRLSPEEILHLIQYLRYNLAPTSDHINPK
jgi:hypothetical protein